jgi:hypothetical protein
VCPNGQRRDRVLECPIWQASVKPSLLERIVGTVAALFGGKW